MSELLKSVARLSGARVIVDTSGPALGAALDDRGLCESADQMRVLRFIAGVGLGSIIPNATALVGEFSPKRTRVAKVVVDAGGGRVLGQGLVLGRHRCFLPGSGAGRGAPDLTRR